MSFDKKKKKNDLTAGVYFHFLYYSISLRARRLPMQKEGYEASAIFITAPFLSDEDRKV